jgi:hypothetical protein
MSKFGLQMPFDSMFNLIIHLICYSNVCTISQSVKPENLMLSTEETRGAVIQLVDFGCAHVEGEDDE